MKTLQSKWHSEQWTDQLLFSELDSENTLIMVFGDLPQQKAALTALYNTMPQSIIIGCTTAGEIAQTHVQTHSLIATIYSFEKTSISVTTETINERGQSFNAGKNIAKTLVNNDLALMFLLTDGMNINGSALIKGADSVIKDTAPITGGLAGDNLKFEQAFTLLNQTVEENQVVAIGLYSQDLEVCVASKGGWKTFGPKRVITQAQDNILYKFDHCNALDIYKKYLGVLSEKLPSSGLHYPIEICEPDKSNKVVRTLLAIDETKGSIVFAGEIPENSTAQLMRANTESLIDGAENAARLCIQQAKQPPQAAILISCVGRMMVLKQLVEEEVEAVQTILGKECLLSGFYSYGEIAPFSTHTPPELHNQTMTITTFSEQ